MKLVWRLSEIGVMARVDRYVICSNICYCINVYIFVIGLDVTGNVYNLSWAIYSVINNILRVTLCNEIAMPSYSPASQKPMIQAPNLPFVIWECPTQYLMNLWEFLRLDSQYE